MKFKTEIIIEAFALLGFMALLFYWDMVKLCVAYLALCETLNCINKILVKEIDRRKNFK